MWLLLTHDHNMAAYTWQVHSFSSMGQSSERH